MRRKTLQNRKCKQSLKVCGKMNKPWGAGKKKCKDHLKMRQKGDKPERQTKGMLGDELQNSGVTWRQEMKPNQIISTRKEEARNIQLLWQINSNYSILWCLTKADIPVCIQLLDSRDAGIRQKQSNQEHPSSQRSTSVFCVNPWVVKVRRGSSENQPLNRQEREAWSGGEISEWLFCKLCWAVDVRLALWHHYLSIWHEMCHIIHGDGIDGESHGADWEETCKQNNRWVFIQPLW